MFLYKIQKKKKKMVSFFRPVLNFFVVLVGGSFTIAFCSVAVLLTVYALLDMSQEYHSIFQKTARIVGIIEIIFGLILPFRQISFFGTLLCVWWTLLLFHSIPKFEVIQFAVNALFTIIFWVTCSPDTEFVFFTTIGDWTVYVLLPIVFSLVDLSKTSDLSSMRSGNTLNDLRIPLDQWLKKLRNFANRVV